MHPVFPVWTSCKSRTFPVPSRNIILYLNLLHVLLLQLEETCKSMAIKEELQRTQFLVSEDSLLHSGEYRARLEVLKQLNYVDEQGTRQFFHLKNRNFFSHF